MKEIVIKLDNVDYEYIKNGCIVPIKIDNHIYDAIRNGKVLPKGHGELKDVSKFVYDCDYDNGYGCDKICYCDGCAHHIIKESSINKAETLVEADKGEA